MEINDYSPLNFTDYVISGDCTYYKDEILAWGGEWDEDHDCYILENSNEMCSDYQALTEFGLTLYSTKKLKGYL